jgi:hypothetical protein
MRNALRQYLGSALLCAIGGAVVLAAQGQQPGQQPGQESPDQQAPPGQQPGGQQPNRPTLGPPPGQPNHPTLGAGPSLAGPHAPNTNDAGRLMHVHTIFIEQMDNGLAEKLVEQIGGKGMFRIVADRRTADAILHGTCFDSTRLKVVHSEVFLSSRTGDSIWQDIVRQPYKPPPLAEAVATTAQSIAEDLAESVREARRK